jgi:hypothetical protein
MDCSISLGFGMATCNTELYIGIVLLSYCEYMERPERESRERGVLVGRAETSGYLRSTQKYNI